jgi:isoleucyl-tRNA synthetase
MASKSGGKDGGAATTGRADKASGGEGGRDWGKTLFLPKTEFPMKAGLPKLEPRLLERWSEMGLYERLRAAGRGKPKFLLHDGPPYANGNIHIGHALNKILKDLVVKSQTMLGHESNYVPGWDCHGLPIEWKIEEQYRAKGLNKDEVPINEFRAECREFAEHWIDVQREEFKRLGIVGDWANPYETMTYAAEATIAAELMKFAMNGTLYRGSKPVMWSVVEKTALAEAEVEYHDHQSDTIWVKFPVAMRATIPGVPGIELLLDRVSVVIWTTTPWTIPANRAISYSSKIKYGLYEVTEAPVGNWAQPGEKFLLADNLAPEVMKAAKVEAYEQRATVSAEELSHLVVRHPLANMGYNFPVPLIDGDHVTEEVGTGFVHTAPGHGQDDYKAWVGYKLDEWNRRIEAANAEISAGKLDVGGSDRPYFLFRPSTGDGEHLAISWPRESDVSAQRWSNLFGKLTDLLSSQGPTSTGEWAQYIRKQFGDAQIRQIEKAIPITVDADGVLTSEAPGFEGKRVLTAKGDKGDANDAVIKALAEAGNIIARGRLKHQYPHSWRSKTPVIFRNTPQWFIAMDKPVKGVPKGSNQTLRQLALRGIDETEWVPASGENRIRSMVEGRPDWVVSRQRAWGVPITVFRNAETGEVIPSPKFAKSKELIARITDAFADEGSDYWFKDGAKDELLTGLVDDPAQWEQARDILDVWFDSGSTHSFVLDDPKHFPGLADINRLPPGGVVPEARKVGVPEARKVGVPEARKVGVPEAREKYDRVMYLEGSDQHRGWFQSSLLESCGTRGRAPYDTVLTHGFILDEKGEEKMSKSKGNTLSPQDVIKGSGADILRLWVASADYTGDIRFGPGIVQAAVEAYRKLRNTIRWMLGALAHLQPEARVKFKDMREMELERLMLHRLSELDAEVRAAYAGYDYRKVVALLTHFMNAELSAFYFDIRKDALYCEPYSSLKRRAALTVIDEIFSALVVWLAPILSFTAEEAWLAREPGREGSVHLQQFPQIDPEWRNDELARKWELVRDVRRVITGALELERADKRIGSSLEAAPEVYVADKALLRALEGVDLAEVSITSAAKLIAKAPPQEAFTLPDLADVGVVPKRAEGRKCARSWRIRADVGADPEFPELSARDAAAVREFDQRTKDVA